MASSYAEFLAGKAQLDGATGVEPVWMPDFLFPFQRQLTEWAIRQGRAGLFEDCGLGKAVQALVWAENVRRTTGKPVLFLTPLGVTHQIAAEAAKFGIEAAISRDGRVAAGITVTNYDRLHHFNPLDYGGVVGDESSAIKAFAGVLRAAVTEFMRRMPFRLLCTATAAPNDYIEVGTSSEALGYLGYQDMLSRFFTTNQRTSFRRGEPGGAPWRFKGHAEQAFWRWVASWARAIRKPSDLGFPDDGFALPPLEHRLHIVSARTRPEGMLFDLPAVGLHEEREEQRRTIAERCEMAAELLADAESGIAWCHLNDEGDLLAKLIPGSVQVAGKDHPDQKEEALREFGEGQIRVLVTKPSIAAWGLNYQHCHRMTYFPSHSYEAKYQAEHRCHRFGQRRPVRVDLVTTEAGVTMLRNLERKTVQADAMFDALVLHMQDALSIRRSDPFDTRMEVPAWL